MLLTGAGVAHRRTFGAGAELSRCARLRGVSNDPRNAPALRKSERTRRAILDAALTFLWTHPFRDLTVGELMSLAGTSRSAFYRYFEDLHDLMEVLLRGVEEDIIEVAGPWLQGEG